MHYNDLGSTGLSVSEIGFGAWGIGGWSPGQLSYGDTDDATSLAALRRAFEVGINFVDTAPLYGLGHSEILVGQAIKENREEWVIATKAGVTDYGAPADYSPGAIEKSLEASLERLGTSYVDLLQLHSPPMDLLRQQPGIVGRLEGLAKKGLIRAWGLSAISPAEAQIGIREFGFRVVQVNFNMLDIRALDCGLFDAAREHGAAVMARTPLSFGFLSGSIAADTVFPAQDHRSRWNGPRVANWVKNARRAMDYAGAETPAARIEAALRFCLSFPEVSVVIPGILTRREAEENAHASLMGPLPQNVVESIIAMNREKGSIENRP